MTRFVEPNVAVWMAEVARALVSVGPSCGGYTIDRVSIGFHGEGTNYAIERAGDGELCLTFEGDA